MVMTTEEWECRVHGPSAEATKNNDDNDDDEWTSTAMTSRLQCQKEKEPMLENCLCHNCI